MFGDTFCPITSQKDRAYLSADQNVDANATVTVAFDKQTFGSGLTDNKIKLERDGYYIVRWKVKGTNFDVELMLNDTVVDDSQRGAEIVKAYAGDEFWVRATDTSGAANTIRGGEYDTCLTVIKLA